MQATLIASSHTNLCLYIHAYQEFVPIKMNMSRGTNFIVLLLSYDRFNGELQSVNII